VLFLSFLNNNVAILLFGKLAFYEASSEYKDVKMKLGSHPQHLCRECELKKGLSLKSWSGKAQVFL
jgi:hypothetical protein